MPVSKSTTILYLPYIPVNKPPEMTMELKSKWYYDLGKLGRSLHAMTRDPLGMGVTSHVKKLGTT